MTNEQLKNGVLVHHRDKGTNYRVVHVNMRTKDSQHNWIDGVVYAPLYRNDYDCFCRSKVSFLEDFDLVIPRYVFSKAEVDKARQECLKCSELGGSGYCPYINSASLVSKYERCGKITKLLK